jgi:cytochrome c553
MHRTRLSTCVVLLVAASGVFPPAARGVPTAGAELEAALRARPNLTHGAETFDTCAACHAANGAGANDGSVPAIAGQHFRVIVKQLVEFRHDARIDIRMQHFVSGDRLARAQDLADVAAYVAVLAPAHARENRTVGSGQGTYLRYCESCHGARAEGNGVTGVPRLAGQHVEYLIRQLGDAAEGRRPAMGRDHARVLLRLDSTETAALAAYVAALDSG